MAFRHYNYVDHVLKIIYLELSLLLILIVFVSLLTSIPSIFQLFLVFISKMATSLLSIQPVNSFLHSTFDDRDYSLSKQDISKERSERQYRSVIVTLFGNKKTMCLTFPTDAHITIFDIKQVVYNRLLLEPKHQNIYTTSGKLLNDNTYIFENNNEEFVNVNLKIRILGGKGGFGSMLRAQGGKMASQKTTNFEACRDLNGRRLRTVNEARRYFIHDLYILNL
jgi:hypothetical protein